MRSQNLPGAPGTPASILYPAVPLAAALLLRTWYAYTVPLFPFDTWRHLALFQNILDGKGFALLGGQPYFWYHPLWYLTAAPFFSVFGVRPVVVFFSTAMVALFYGYTLTVTRSRPAAAVSAGMLAVFGPAVLYTVTYGTEAFTLCLMLAGLFWAAQKNTGPRMLAAGMLFGLGVLGRLHYSILGFLFLPLFTRKNIWAFSFGFALPLASAWLRNFWILKTWPWVFTLDGLAVKSRDFDWLSTFFITFNKSIIQLGAFIDRNAVPFVSFDGFNGLLTLALLALGLGIVVAAKKKEIWAAIAFFAFSMALYGKSSYHLRHYIPCFLLIFLSFAHLFVKIKPGGRGTAMAAAAIALVLVAGFGYILPGNRPGVFKNILPAECLAEDAYMVNSSVVSPEGYAFFHPGKRFIGMPLEVSDLEDFEKSHPDFRYVLWQDGGPRNPYAPWVKVLLDTGRYTVLRRCRLGRDHFILERTRPPAVAR